MTKLIVGKNDLKTLFPKIAESWDYENNQGKRPEDYCAHSNQKVNWFCKKCGFHWAAKISNRVRKNKGGCPGCSGKIFAKGINDLETTHPEIANEWDYKLNAPLKPSDIMHGTRIEYWWICPVGHKSYKQSPNKRTSQNAGCPICNKGKQTSFAEQALYFYIKKLYPNTINKYTEIFNNTMELDIFIPEINTAIEYDGVAFHKKDKIKREIQKYKICKDNNIRLIRIKEEKITDENFVTLNETADLIIQTQYDGKNYNELGNTIDWILTKLNFKSFHHKIDINIERDKYEIKNQQQANMRENSLFYLYPEIAKEWHPTKNGNLLPYMVASKSSFEVYWKCQKCGYEWKSSVNTRVNSKYGCKNCYLKAIKENCPNNKKIYQYSLDNTFLAEWKSVSYAGRCLNINSSNISMCANGKRSKAGGYIWKYIKD